MSKPTFDPSVGEAVKDIQAGKGTRWAVFGYEKTSDRIVVVEKGNGGDLDDLQEELNDGKVLFAYVRYDINGIQRFLFVGWCGDGVQGMRKGNYTAHAKEVESFCKPHATVHARNERDIDDANFRKLLTKAMGANYDAGGKIQGTKDTSSAKKDETKAIDGFKVDKGESAAFWADEKKKEVDRKNLEDERVKLEQARLTDNQKAETANINAKWENMKQTKAASAPAVAKPSAASSSSSSSSTFSSSAPAPTTAPRVAAATSAPAPKVAAAPVAVPRAAAAPPPRQPEPEFEPEPEPEPVREPEPEPEPEPVPEPEPEAQPPQEQYVEEEQEQQQNYEGGEGQAAEGDGSVQFVALYDYDAQEEGELTFKAGEIIWVVNQDAGGWWTGQREDYTTGLFPGNYVGPIQQ